VTEDWLKVTRRPGLTLTERWLFIIGIVIGFVHLADVLAANAENALEFVPAVILWLIMLAICIFDRPLTIIWTAIGLIPVSLAWAIGGVMRHVGPLLTKGDEPAAVTGTFSTIVGLGLIGLSIVSLVRWRRSVKSAVRPARP